METGYLTRYKVAERVTTQEENEKKMQALRKENARRRREMERKRQKEKEQEDKKRADALMYRKTDKQRFVKYLRQGGGTKPSRPIANEPDYGRSSSPPQDLHHPLDEAPGDYLQTMLEDSLEASLSPSTRSPRRRLDVCVDSAVPPPSKVASPEAVRSRTHLADVDDAHAPAVAGPSRSPRGYGGACEHGRMGHPCHICAAEAPATVRCPSPEDLQRASRTRDKSHVERGSLLDSLDLDTELQKARDWYKTTLRRGTGGAHPSEDGDGDAGSGQPVRMRKTNNPNQYGYARGFTRALQRVNAWGAPAAADKPRSDPKRIAEQMSQLRKDVEQLGHKISNFVGAPATAVGAKPTTTRREKARATPTLRNGNAVPVPRQASAIPRVATLATPEQPLGAGLRPEGSNDVGEDSNEAQAWFEYLEDVARGDLPMSQMMETIAQSKLRGPGRDLRQGGDQPAVRGRGEGAAAGRVGVAARRPGRRAVPTGVSIEEAKVEASLERIDRQLEALKNRDHDRASNAGTSDGYLGGDGDVLAWNQTQTSVGSTATCVTAFSTRTAPPAANHAQRYREMPGKFMYNPQPNALSGRPQDKQSGKEGGPAPRLRRVTGVPPTRSNPHSKRPPLGATSRARNPDVESRIPMPVHADVPLSGAGTYRGRNPLKNDVAAGGPTSSHGGIGRAHSKEPTPADHSCRPPVSDEAHQHSTAASESPLRGELAQAGYPFRGEPRDDGDDARACDPLRWVLSNLPAPRPGFPTQAGGGGDGRAPSSQPLNDPHHHRRIDSQLHSNNHSHIHTAQPDNHSRPYPVQPPNPMQRRDPHDDPPRNFVVAGGVKGAHCWSNHVPEPRKDSHSHERNLPKSSPFHPDPESASSRQVGLHAVPRSNSPPCSDHDNRGGIEKFDPDPDPVDSYSDCSFEHGSVHSPNSTPSSGQDHEPSNTTTGRIIMTSRAANLLFCSRDG
eukprot:Rmarinus@m.5876